MRATRLTQERSTRALLGARRDVVEHQFIRALVAIAQGEIQDVADDAMVAKAHALDDLPVADVETGNYAFGKNARSSSMRYQFLEQGLAADRRGRAACGQGAQIGCVADAAGCLPLRCCGKRRTASAYNSMLGPVSAPSRLTSVQSTCWSSKFAKSATASHSGEQRLPTPRHGWRRRACPPHPDAHRRRA